MNSKIALFVLITGIVLSLIGFTQADTRKPYTSRNYMPGDLDFTIETLEGNTTGRLYFEATHVFNERNNYIIEIDRATGEIIMTKRLPSFGMKFERHNNDLMSWYEYSDRTWKAQDQRRGYGGIRYHTGGVMQLMNNDYKIVGTIEDSINIDSHDLVWLENDNYLYFAPEMRPIERDSTLTCLLECYLLGQNIVQLSPDGTTRTIWRALDYYEQSDFIMNDVFELNHNILYDVIHANAVTVAPHSGNYVISMRHPHGGEVMVIDPSGSLVWRSRDYTIDSPFSHQHDAQLLSNGNLLLFDNGNGIRNYSRAVEYELDHEQQTMTLVWEYHNGHFAPNRGSVQRLSNGNTLINMVDGGVLEVTSASETVLHITMPEHVASYRARLYEVIE